MNKTIIAVVVVLVVVLGGYLVFNSTRPTPVAAPQTSDQPTTQQPPVTQPPATQPPVASGTVVTYTDSGYSPAVLTIKKGDTVTFKNQSSQEMWTASGVHPTHRVYPTTGGCIGSTFDACKGIQSGDSWSFRFDIAGIWKYHNHLKPSDTGTIVVQ